MGNTISYYTDSQPIKIDNLLKSLITDQTIFKVNTNFINCYYRDNLEMYYGNIIAYINILKPFRCDEIDEMFCNPDNFIILYLNNNIIEYEIISVNLEFKNFVINKPNISFGDNNIKYKLININIDKMDNFKKNEKFKFPLNDYQLYKFIKIYNDNNFLYNANFSRLEKVYYNDTSSSEKVNNEISFCQMCTCTFQEYEHKLLSYQPISLSGEILDIINIYLFNIILVNYYSNGNIEIKVYDKEENIAELEKYYINEIIYDETENILKQTKIKYLEHIKKKIIYYI